MTSSNDNATDLITLKSLRTLSSVARSGSLTRAAAELGLAQSAVSRQVRELEKALGDALFHRTGRGVQRTKFADQILPRVQNLLLQADELAHTSRTHAGTPSGTVTLGLVPGVANFLAAAVYGMIKKRYPQIHLHVVEAYSGDIETALTQGKIDLAVLNRYRAKGSNSYRRLFDSQLCVVGKRQLLQRALTVNPKGKTSHARSRSSLPLSTNLQGLARLPLAMPLPPNASRNLLDELSHRHGLELNLVLEGSSLVIIKSMLMQHDCASVMPRHAVADELHAGTLVAVPLSERAFRQHVVLATSSQRPFTLASKAVAELIPDVVTKMLARKA